MPNLLNPTPSEDDSSGNLLNSIRTGANNFMSDITQPNPLTRYGMLAPIARDQGGNGARFGAPVVLQDAYNAFMTPGRAARGQLSMDQMISGGRSLAGFLTGGEAFGASAPAAAASSEMLQTGRAALAKALETKSDVMGAMNHPELGPIDFRWGNAKSGIQHILEKHGADAYDVPDIIANGDVGQHYQTPQGRLRLDINLGDKKVVLSPDYYGDPGRWVVTAFDKDKGK